MIKHEIVRLHSRTPDGVLLFPEPMRLTWVKHWGVWHLIGMEAI